MNLVVLKDNQVKTTSNIVAETFGKAHKNVLQKIESLEIPEDFNRLNFQPVEYQDEKGELRKAYEITRDGFTLLAMGFTGKKAMEFKIKYINAFNEMEEALKAKGIISVREHTRRPPSGKKEVVLSEKEHKAIGGIVKSCVQSVLKEVKPDSGLSGRERNLLDILRACGYDMKANDASWADTFSGLDGFIIQGHYERIAIMAMRAAVAQEMLKTASEAEKPKYLAIRNENLKRIHRQSVVNEAGLHCIA